MIYTIYRQWDNQVRSSYDLVDQKTKRYPMYTNKS